LIPRSRPRLKRGGRICLVGDEPRHLVLPAARPAAVRRQHARRFPVPAVATSQGHVVRPREASVVHHR
jgi:hypothetical protein